MDPHTATPPEGPPGWSDLRGRAAMTAALHRLAAALPAPASGGGAPATGRWDLDIVADAGPAQLLWRDTVQDFARLARRSRAFHRVTTRLLVPGRGGAGGAATGPGGPGRPRGGRLVLLLTDGIDPGWSLGTMDPLLHRWAREGPVAIGNLLPHAVWPNSRLAVWPTLLRAPHQGSANRQLRWRNRGLGPELPTPDRERGVHLPIPVLELDAQWLTAWSELLGPPGPEWIPLPAAFTGAIGSEPGNPPPGSPAEQVDRLRGSVSGEVFHLATALAATPLTLPLIQAVQRAVLPGGRVSDVVQLVLQSVLNPCGEAREAREAGSAGSRPVLAFAPGLREELLATGRSDALRRVVQVIGDRLPPGDEQLWRLPRLLRGENVALDLPPVTESTLPWVEVEKAVLQALSGEYLAPARELERLLAAHRAGTVSEPEERARPAETAQPRRRTGMTQEPMTVPAREPRTTPTVWGNIPPRNPNFTGREDLLESLHQRLLKEHTTAVLPHALHGMGGVGKSLLAIEYLYRRLGDYDVVWWITAERTTQISLSLVELAPRLGLQPSGDSSSTVAAVLEALRRGVPYSNWLLVFDNAESPESVSSFFPQGGPGNILVTSRNPQWASIARPLEVDVFRREESKHLLRVRGPEISDSDADRLAEALGDLPLAIEQAAAWHAETGMLADEYLRLLSEKRVDLLSVSAPLDYQLPVIAAWNISLDQLESKNPAALQLLQVCSFCAPEPISRTLFARMQGRPIAPELDAALADPIRLGQVIREIGRYSLARFDHRTNSIQMHRLVQTALLARMTADEQARMRHGTHLLLAANDPNNPSAVDRWARYGELYPHVLVSGALHSPDPWVRTLVINECKYLMYWGDYESGRSLARTAYEDWRETLGSDHPQTLRVARWLGFLLFNMGRYAEAAALNAVVVEAYARSFGEDHQDTVDATGNVAIDHRVRGDFHAALDLSRTVHRRYVRLLGPEEPETLRAAHNVGVCLRLAGDFAAARQLDEETWHSRIRIYGQDHVDSLRTWLGLVVDIRELGDYAVALTYHREIVTQARNLLGAANPLALSALRHLAVALRKAGHHEEALATARQVQADLVRRFGDHNPESMAATLELTSHLRHPEATGGSAEHPIDMGTARELGAVILREYSTTYGELHPHTLSAAVNLAVSHRLSGDPGRALEIDERVLGEFRSRLGEDHPSTLICLTNLASDHYEAGDVDRAADLDRDTLERSRRVFDEDHPSTLAVAANLSMDLRESGRTEEARALNLDTVERLGVRLGPDHPAVAQAAGWDHRANCDIDPMPL